MHGVPRRKRELPPELVAMDGRIENWRSALLSRLPARLDVARFLLASVTSHQIGVVFERSMPRMPHHMGEVEQVARSRLFGLYFALTGLQGVLPHGRFVTELVASALTTEQGREALEAIDAMSVYASARDAFLTYQWGGYEVADIGPNYVRFVDPPTWKGTRDRAEQVLAQEIKAERAFESLSGGRSRLVRPLRFLAEEVDLPPALPLGGITVEQFAHAWLSLIALLMTHPEGLSQVLEKPALIRGVAGSAQLSEDTTRGFVDLLSFEQSQHRALTLFHTPLVPLTDSSIMAGWGLMFGNPATCMLRLAIHRGPGINAVTKAMESHLLDMLRRRFEQPGIVVRANVPYDHHADRGDIDFVAYDVRSHRTMLGMVKAFIPPDTVDEVVRTNQALEDGLVQIERARRWWHGGGGAALPAQLGTSSARGVPETDWIVIGNGFAGSDYLQVPDGVSVVDAHFLLRPRLAGMDIFDAVAAYAARLRDEMRNAEKAAGPQELALAGIRIEVPGWSLML